MNDVIIRDLRHTRQSRHTTLSVPRYRHTRVVHKHRRAPASVSLYDLLASYYCYYYYYFAMKSKNIHQHHRKLTGRLRRHILSRASPLCVDTWAPWGVWSHPEEGGWWQRLGLLLPLLLLLLLGTRRQEEWEEGDAAAACDLSHRKCQGRAGHVTAARDDTSACLFVFSRHLLLMLLQNGQWPSEATSYCKIHSVSTIM